MEFGNFKIFRGVTLFGLEDGRLRKGRTLILIEPD